MVRRLQVLRFLDKHEISDIVDDSANKVISYLLKKVLFSQPERLNRPVSEQEAIQDWITSGHAERFNICYTRNEDEIERTIQESGLVPILQDKSKLHGLLRD